MTKLICKYCGDPILSFQEKTMKEGMHEGCYQLKEEGKLPDKDDEIENEIELA